MARPATNSTKPVTVTFVGGPGAGNVGSTEWGNKKTGIVTFPLREPVVFDMEGRSAPEKAFLSHIVNKARANPFFEVGEATGAANEIPAKVVDPTGVIRAPAE